MKFTQALSPTLMGLVLVCGNTYTAPPNPDFTGLRLGNSWTFTGGTSAVIDRVDSTAEGWKYRRVAREVCPLCKEKAPVTDTSWALVRGDSVFQTGPETAGRWALAIVLPPRAGLQWITDPVEHESLAWVCKGTVRVPAGTFSDCWRLRGTDSSEVWVQKGAGLLRLQQGSGLVELESFHRGEGP